MNLLILSLCYGAVSSSPLIWKEKIINDDWFHLLGNPCRAEPTPPDWANDPVLNATGRAKDIYYKARGAKYYVEEAANLMVSIV